MRTPNVAGQPTRRNYRISSLGTPVPDLVPAGELPRAARWLLGELYIRLRAGPDASRPPGLDDELVRRAAAYLHCGRLAPDLEDVLVGVLVASGLPGRLRPQERQRLAVALRECAWGEGRTRKDMALALQVRAALEALGEVRRERPAAAARAFQRYFWRSYRENLGATWAPVVSAPQAAPRLDRDALSGVAPDAALDPEEELLTRLDADARLEAAGLPERQAQVLELWLQGYPYREIGRRLQISRATVKTHLQRALATLRGPAKHA